MLKSLKKSMDGYSQRRRANGQILKTASGAPGALANLADVIHTEPSVRKAPIQIRTHIRIVNIVDVDTVNESFKVSRGAAARRLAPRQ